MVLENDVVLATADTTRSRLNGVGSAGAHRGSYRHAADRAM